MSKTLNTTALLQECRAPSIGHDGSRTKSLPVARGINADDGSPGSPHARHGPRIAALIHGRHQRADGAGREARFTAQLAKGPSEIEELRERPGRRGLAAGRQTLSQGCEREPTQWVPAVEGRLGYCLGVTSVLFAARYQPPLKPNIKAT